jgi:hypothetical protein
MYKKIDLVVKKAGKRFYLCSTTQSKTCKEAVQKFLSRYNKTDYIGTCGTWYIDNNVSGQFDHNK